MILPVLGLLGLVAAFAWSDGGGPGPGPSGGAVRAVPVRGARLSSGFGMRLHPSLKIPKPHTGIDLAAPAGTHIWAVEGGEVVRVDVAGQGKGLVNGHAVHVQSPSGRWSYLHMATLPPVRVGQRVSAGQLLGRVGSTGRSTGPHLHLSLWRGGVPVDPWPIVGPLYGGTIAGGEPSLCTLCFGEAP